MSAVGNNRCIELASFEEKRARARTISPNRLSPYCIDLKDTDSMSPISPGSTYIPPFLINDSQRNKEEELGIPTLVGRKSITVDPNLEYERRLSEWVDINAFVIGKGVFGRTLLCKDGSAVAKLQSPRRAKEEKLREHFVDCAESETNLHKELSEAGVPHIPRLISHFSLEGTRYALIMENVGESLKSRVEEKGYPLKLNEVEGVAKRILEALVAMHGKNVAHLDIKVANCSSRGELFDFGLSMKVNDQGLTGLTTTWESRAPEIALGYSFGTQADLWSAGMVFLNSYLGASPLYEWGYTHKYTTWDNLSLILAIRTFLGDSSDLDKMVEGSKDMVGSKDKILSSDRNGNSFGDLVIQKARLNKDPQERVELFIDLLSNLLEVHPAKRITAKKARDHEFFSSDSSADISFKIKIEGNVDRKIQILNADQKVLSKIDLSKNHLGSCYHIPKSGKRYAVHLLSKGSEDKSLISKVVKLVDMCVLNVNTNTNNISIL